MSAGEWLHRVAQAAERAGMSLEAGAACCAAKLRLWLMGFSVLLAEVLPKRTGCVACTSEGRHGCTNPVACGMPVGACSEIVILLIAPKDVIAALHNN